jgi:ubiquitin C-terminal hydrolase
LYKLPPTLLKNTVTMSKSAKKRKKERERKLLLEQQQHKDPHARKNPAESPREQVVAKSLFRAPNDKQVPAKSPQCMEPSPINITKEQIVGDNANNNPSKTFGSRKRTLTAVAFVYPKTKDTYHFGGKQIAGKSSETPKDSSLAEEKTDNAPSYRTNVSIEEILYVKKKRRKGENGEESHDAGKGQSATTHAESTPRSPKETKTPDPPHDLKLQVDGKGDRKKNSNGNSQTHVESTPLAGKGQSTTKTPDPTRDLNLPIGGKGDRKKNSNGNAGHAESKSKSPVETDPSRERKVQVDGKGERKKTNGNGHADPKSKSPIETDSSRERKVQVDGTGEKKQNSNGNGHADPKSKSPKQVARAPEVPESGHLSGMTVEKVVRDEMGCRPRANSTDGELNLPQGGLCDERKVLQAHKWNLDKQDFSKQVSPKGFVNLGNTCFLNSTLQCLAYLPPMCQSLMAMPEAHDIGKNSMTGKTSQGKKVTLMLRSLFRQVHGANGSTFAGHALAPKSIVRAVPSLGSVGSRNGYKFRPGRQEDAHEFLVHLLDAMNDGELKESGMNPRASGWRDRMPIARLDETTFIHRIFGGYLRSQVRCTSCGYCSNTYDPFLDLSLEVSRKSCHSIYNAILEFTRKETLDSENRWKCSGCKKRVCASKQLTVFRPPLTLCVQLKRFTFGGSGFGLGGGHGHKNFGGGQGGKKISKPIEFPADLKLPLSDARSCEYALTGIIIHVGGSASSGHYTAYVKKPSTNGGHQWFHMDDSFVESVSERTVLKQRDAYVLFYCRKEVKVEFPSPPLRSSMSAEEAKKFGRVRAKARADSITEDPDTRNLLKAGEKSLSPLAGSGVATKSHSTPARSSHDVAPKSSRAESNEKAQTSSTSEDSDDEVGRSPSVKDSTASTASSMSEGNERKSKGGANTPISQISRTSGTSHSSLESLGSESSDSESEPELTSSVANKRSKPSLSESSTSTEVSEELTPSLVATSVPEKDDESSEESSSGSLMSEESDKKPKAAVMATSVPEEDESSSSSSESSVASDNPPATGKMSPSSTVASSTDVSESAVGEKKGKSILQIAKNAVRTRVVFGKAEGRGKVEVMMGPRFKTKAWKPSTVPAAKGQEFHLLGNLKVDAWGDASDDDSPPEARRGQIPASNERAGIVQQVEKKERKRKRQMFVDRWDANLDLGKVSTCRTVFCCCIKLRLCSGATQLTKCFFIVVTEIDKENEEQRRQGTSGRPGSEEECLSAHTSWCPKNEPRKGERLSQEPKGTKAKGTKAKGQGQEVTIQILTI